MSATKRNHVGVLAFPFSSHPISLLSLTRRLAVEAPDASFSFFGTHKSNAHLSSPDHPNNLKLYNVSDGVPEKYVFVGKPQENIELFMKTAVEILTEALEGVVKERGEVTCLFTDSFLWFAGEMAEKMGVPWVAFWTSTASSLASHIHTDIFRRTFGMGAEASTRQDEHLNIVPCLSWLRVRDLPEGIVMGPLDSFLSHLLHRMAKESSRAKAVAVNTFEGLEPAVLKDLRNELRSCLPVGPLPLLSPSSPHVHDPHACLAWLDCLVRIPNPRSVVYISFGKVGMPPPDELTALAHGLEESGAPFLWCLKDNAKEGLPAGFLERTKGRGMVVPWAPQKRVLGHVAVGALVSHAGWNSVPDSIAGGVPMICHRLLGENGINERMVTNVLKIGVGLEGGVFTKDGVVESIELLLRKDEGRKMRERVGALREVAKEAVSDGGSSAKSLKELLRVMIPT